MKLTCLYCGGHDIFTEEMLTGEKRLSGVFQVKGGKEIQLEAWYCHDCGYQGIHADFVPGAKRRVPPELRP